MMNANATGCSSVFSWRICCFFFLPVLQPWLEQTREPLGFLPLGPRGMAPDCWEAWVHAHLLSVLPCVPDPQAGTGAVQGIHRNKKHEVRFRSMTSVFLSSKAVWTYFPFSLCRLLGNILGFWQQDDPVSLTVAKVARSFQCASVGEAVWSD